MARDAFHVVPHGDGWAVKREGVERVHSTHDTQKAAIDAARDAAKEGDELVIHRTDGTIRENVTVTGASAARGGNGNGNGGDREARDNRENRDRETRRDRDDDRPRYTDIWSVGSRVSWSAIVAGIIVALATSALLTAFAAAIQIPLLDNMSVRGVEWYTIVAAVVVLLASMFLGGFVASRLTTRETSGESVIYGVLVWGGFSALATFGLGAGARLGLDVFNTARTGETEQASANHAVSAPATLPGVNTAVRTSENAKDGPKVEKTDGTEADTAKRSRAMSATTKGWIAFMALLLPLLSAIGGALAGCGEDPTRRVRPGETPGNLPVENRIAQFERAGA